MKRISILLYVLTILASANVAAQDKKPLSPKETVKGKYGDANVEIVYSRPSARGRKMLGGNEKYGEVWRTGANEATTIEFSKPVKVEGKDLPAGKYELFTIPNENEWVVIFQKFSKQWGHYGYKKENDVLRVNVKPKKTGSFVETFTITPAENEIRLEWENTSAAFSVKG